MLVRGLIGVHLNVVRRLSQPKVNA